MISTHPWVVVAPLQIQLEELLSGRCMSSGGWMNNMMEQIDATRWCNNLQEYHYCHDGLWKLVSTWFNCNDLHVNAISSTCGKNICWGKWYGKSFPYLPKNGTFRLHCEVRFHNVLLDRLSVLVDDAWGTCFLLTWNSLMALQEPHNVSWIPVSKFVILHTMLSP